MWDETEGLTRVWVWSGFDESGARGWAEEHDIDTTVLLDGDGSVHQAYFMAEPEDAFARNPRHFIIDREGRLVYAGDNLDPDREDAALTAALAD
ncbi:MAG: redoxin family protein [Proteobacteria bacterium]|nr:redoxin family protein [Pseudomonadota bacterium]